MIVTVAMLRAAGLTEAQIIRVADLADKEAIAEKREKWRIAKQNQRSGPQMSTLSSGHNGHALSLREDLSKKVLKKEPRPKKLKIALPDDWQPKGPQRDPAEADEFRNKARARAWAYADWDAAYFNYQKHPEYNWRNKNGYQPPKTDEHLSDQDRQDFIAMQEKQREVVQRMRAQGASQDEIKEAVWGPEVAGRWASEPGKLGRTNGMVRNGGKTLER